MADKETSSQEPRVIVHNVQDAPLSTGINLDDRNFPLWSQPMEMCIGERNKSGTFLTGTTMKPSTDDKQLESWLIDNNRVKRWLTYLTLDCKEIWEVVAKTKTFYDDSSEMQLLELKKHTMEEPKIESDVIVHMATRSKQVVNNAWINNKLHQLLPTLENSID